MIAGIAKSQFKIGLSVFKKMRQDFAEISGDPSVWLLREYLVIVKYFHDMTIGALLPDVRGVS